MNFENDIRMDFETLRQMEQRFAAIRKIRSSMNESGVVYIVLSDGREVSVDIGGHITVWKDGEVEKEIDV